jgi:hypothetical protein
MSLEDACHYWGVKQSEVDYVTSEFEGRSWWRNRRTYEMIECGDYVPRAGRRNKMAKHRLWEVWKEGREWKLQFPKGIETYRTKAQAEDAADLFRNSMRDDVSEALTEITCLQNWWLSVKKPAILDEIVDKESLAYSLGAKQSDIVAAKRRAERLVLLKERLPQEADLIQYEVRDELVIVYENGKEWWNMTKAQFKAEFGVTIPTPPPEMVTRKLVDTGEERTIDDEGIACLAQIHEDPKTGQQFAVMPRGTEVAEVFVIEVKPTD